MKLPVLFPILLSKENKTKMKKFNCLLLANLFVLSLFASHNKAGEIQYRQIGEFEENTIQCYIIMHTDSGLNAADRDSLLLHWGDGAIEWVKRSNGPGSPPQGLSINSRYKQNIYIAEHTYAEYGEYTLAVNERNRSGGIININNGNSDIFSLYLYNTFTLSEEGYNSSPRSLFPPVDLASVFTPFEHLATVYDEEGDSLSYILVTPQMTDGVDVNNFQGLMDTPVSPDNQLSLDPLTGHLVWDSPQIAGVYNIAIEITSYRDGIQNGQFIRDMIIEVANSPIISPVVEQDDLPIFGFIQEVEIGDTIQLSIPTSGENLFHFEAGGGLFSQSQNPSTFDISSTELVGRFLWIVDEAHVRDQPYDIGFKLINVQDVPDFYLIRYKVNGFNTSASILAEDDHDVVVYPNPSSDFLVLKEDAYYFSDYKIYSVSGELIRHGKMASDRLDIRSLSSGSYVLLLDNRYPVKFIKALK